MDRALFQDGLRRCKDIFKKNLGPSSQVRFDWESKLYAELIREDLDMIASLTKKGDRVLDLGCGRGTISSLMSTLGLKVDGIDLSVPSEDRTMERLSTVLPSRIQTRIWESLLSEFGVRFRFYDGVNIPFEDETFSLVLAHAVIEHVEPDRLHMLLSEIKRVLVSGGFFVVSKTPRRHSYVEALAHILGLRGHECLLDQRALCCLVEGYDFEIVSSEQTDMLPSFCFLPEEALEVFNSLYPLLKVLDRSLLSSPLKHLATNMRIVARKRGRRP